MTLITKPYDFAHGCTLWLLLLLALFLLKTRSMKKIIAAICLLIVCMPVFSFAHPGHGSTGGFTIIHYIVEPVHAFYTVAIFISCVVYFRFLVKTRREEQSL